MNFDFFEGGYSSRLLLVVLLHFVWQAALIGWLVALCRSVVHPRFFQVRYWVSVSGLMLMVICAIGTAGYYLTNEAAMRSLMPSEGMSVVMDNVGPTGVLGFFDTAFATVFEWFDSYRVFWLAAWSFGFVVLVGRLSWSLVYCLKIRQNRIPLPHHLERMATDIQNKLRITRRVVVASSRQVTQAVATGIIRPVVLIPASWLTQLPVSAIEAVLAHELSHVKRWDLWINLLQRVTETIFFFHPLVWWVSRAISAEREICCDQLAIQVTGQPMRYVETLAQVANTTQKQEFEFQLGTAFKGGKNMKLLRRARMILEPRTIDVGSPFRTLTMITCMGILASFGPYAYCSMSAAEAALKQDHENGKEHKHRKEHHQSDQDALVTSGRYEFRVETKDDGNSEVRFLIVDNQDSDNEVEELHLKVTDPASMDRSEIARKLRELADQLDAGNHASRTKRVLRKRIVELDRPTENRLKLRNPKSDRFRDDAKKSHERKIRVEWDGDHQNRVRVLEDRVVDLSVDQLTEEVRDLIVELKPHIHNDADVIEVERIHDAGDHEQLLVELHVQDDSNKKSRVKLDPAQNRFIGKVSNHFQEKAAKDHELSRVIVELRGELNSLRKEIDRLKSKKRPVDKSKVVPKIRGVYHIDQVNVEDFYKGDMGSLEIHTVDLIKQDPQLLNLKVRSDLGVDGNFKTKLNPQRKLRDVWVRDLNDSKDLTTVIQSRVDALLDVEVENVEKTKRSPIRLKLRDKAKTDK